MYQTHTHTKHTGGWPASRAPIWKLPLNESVVHTHIKGDNSPRPHERGRLWAACQVSATWRQRAAPPGGCRCSSGSKHADGWYLQPCVCVAMCAWVYRHLQVTGCAGGKLCVCVYVCVPRALFNHNLQLIWPIFSFPCGQDLTPLGLLLIPAVGGWRGGRVGLPDCASQVSFVGLRIMGMNRE